MVESDQPVSSESAVSFRSTMRNRTVIKNKASTLQKSTDKKTEEDELLLADEAGKLLKKSSGAVYRMAQRGELPHLKMGRSIRFKKSKILEFIEGSERVTTEEALNQVNRK